MTAMTVQCNVYVNTSILCEVNVEVVKKHVLLFQKVSVLSNYLLSVTGTFVTKNFHSREQKFHRWNFRFLELSFPDIDY